MFTASRKLLRQPELERPGCWREGRCMRWHSEFHFLSRHLLMQKNDGIKASRATYKALAKRLRRQTEGTVVLLVWEMKTWTLGWQKLEDPGSWRNGKQWSETYSLCHLVPLRLCSHIDLRREVYGYIHGLSRRQRGGNHLENSSSPTRMVTFHTWKDPRIKNPNCVQALERSFMDSVKAAAGLTFTPNPSRRQGIRV